MPKMTITTYAELDRFVRGFKHGHYKMLAIVGRPGTQKSTVVKRVLSDDDEVDTEFRWFNNNVTPFELYRELYKHRDIPVVLDDVDGLFSNPASVRLLKAVCQTDKVKVISWFSAAALLERDEIPKQFETTSRVLITANTLATATPNLNALFDRGYILSFEPSSVEVHIRAAEWVQDTEVYEYIGQYAPLLPALTHRDYETAIWAKQAGDPWKQFLSNIWGLDSPHVRLQIAASDKFRKVMEDTSLITRSQLKGAFIRLGGAESTFNRRWNEFKLRNADEYARRFGHTGTSQIA